MKFRMPKLNSLVSSDKKLEDNDPTKLVTVIRGHAIVCNEIYVAVNLREYVKIECGIVETHDLDVLTEIINWMEGKSFSKEFWSELTNDCFIKLTEEGLEIQNLNYNKVLIYEEIQTSEDTYLAVLRDNLVETSVTVQKIAVNSSYLLLISNTFKKEFGKGSIILESTGIDKALRFSGVRKDYIFGFIPLSYDDANEFTNFMSSLNYGRELEVAYPRERPQLESKE